MSASVYTAKVRFNNVSKQQGGREHANGILINAEGDPIPSSSVNIGTQSVDSDGAIIGLDTDTDYILTLTPAPIAV